MNSIRATWVNGKVVPSGPIDWPEGTELLILPESPGQKIGLDESEWRDDPEAIAEWSAWLDTIEPPILTEEERQSIDRYREEFRRYNIEAVRRQMLEDQT